MSRRIGYSGGYPDAQFASPGPQAGAPLGYPRLGTKLPTSMSSVAPLRDAAPKGRPFLWGVGEQEPSQETTVTGVMSAKWTGGLTYHTRQTAGQLIFTSPASGGLEFVATLPQMNDLLRNAHALVEKSQGLSVVGEASSGKLAGLLADVGNDATDNAGLMRASHLRARASLAGRRGGNNEKQWDLVFGLPENAVQAREELGYKMFGEKFPMLAKLSTVDGILSTWKFRGSIQNLDNMAKDFRDPISRVETHANVACAGPAELCNVWGTSAGEDAKLYLVLKRTRKQDGSPGPFAFHPWSSYAEGRVSSSDPMARRILMHNAVSGAGLSLVRDLHTESPCSSDLAYTDLHGVDAYGAALPVGKVLRGPTNGTSDQSALELAGLGKYASEELAWSKTNMGATAAGLGGKTVKVALATSGLNKGF